MVRAQDMIPVTPGSCAAHGYCNGILYAEVPVYVLYFCRLEWYSGDKIGEGETASTRFAFVRSLPPAEKMVCGHTVFRYDKADVDIANTAYHCLVPVESLTRPLVLDKSVESVLTLVPFLGKGLAHEAAVEPTGHTEQGIPDSEDASDDDNDDDDGN
jgi:hypothetical protein